jgi:hypothetical protein
MTTFYNRISPSLEAKLIVGESGLRDHMLLRDASGREFVVSVQELATIIQWSFDCHELMEEQDQ